MNQINCLSKYFQTDITLYKHKSFILNRKTGQEKKYIVKKIVQFDLLDHYEYVGLEESTAGNAAVGIQQMEKMETSIDI